MITAFGKQGKYLIIFKEREIYSVGYAAKSGTSNTAAFPLTQLPYGRGCDQPGTVRPVARKADLCLSGDVSTGCSLWGPVRLKLSGVFRASGKGPCRGGNGYPVCGNLQRSGICCYVEPEFMCWTRRMMRAAVFLGRSEDPVFGGSSAFRPTGRCSCLVQEVPMRTLPSAVPLGGKGRIFYLPMKTGGILSDGGVRFVPNRLDADGRRRKSQIYPPPGMAAFL